MAGVVAAGLLGAPLLAPAQAFAALPCAAPAYAAAPAVARAEACGPRNTTPLRDQPWPLRLLRPDLVWPLTRGAGVTVAVIDSGVSDNHPALAGRVLDGVDLVAPRDVVIVAAAGNTNGAARPGQPSYPAAYDGVIGVGSAPP